MAEDTTQKLAPVYVPYATLMSSFETLKTHGIPKSGIIDKSIWDSQSGTVQSQLMLAYRFLGFFNAQKEASESLISIIESTSTDSRKALLKPIIEDKYQAVIALGLTSITPTQFDEAFRKFDITGSTLLRATRFFINACSELGIPIGKRFVERKPAVPRKKKPSTGTRPPVEAPANQHGATSGTQSASNSMKTIKLPKVGGSLSISGTFNPFMLMGDERKLLYAIIDLMTEYETNQGDGQ